MVDKVCWRVRANMEWLALPALRLVSNRLRTKPRSRLRMLYISDVARACQLVTSVLGKLKLFVAACRQDSRPMLVYNRVIMEVNRDAVARPTSGGRFESRDRGRNNLYVSLDLESRKFVAAVVGFRGHIHPPNRC